MVFSFYVPDKLDLFGLLGGRELNVSGFGGSWNNRKSNMGPVPGSAFAGALPGARGSPLVNGRPVLPSQVKETRVVPGLGRAGLRRLSRRGSWVQIPPPAPYGLLS